MRTSRWGARSVRRLVVGLAAALLLAACDQTGSATTRIDGAEAEIESIVEDVVEAVSLDVDEVPTVGRRSSCQRLTQDQGAENALSLRADLPDVDDPIGRASAVLVESGYELVDSEEAIGEGVFGRRDGIRITVVVDEPTGQLAIDADTGCRPPPAT